ncbi:MAG: Ig-like domain-containing protein, partial [Acidobacteriota bacterium]
MKPRFIFPALSNPRFILLIAFLCFLISTPGWQVTSGTVTSTSKVMATSAESNATSVVETTESTTGSSLKAMVATASAAAFFAPTVTATKTASPASVSPGGTITYTVTISNSGMDATNVSFNDTIDANTTLVAGSVRATPVAVNDSYSATGNILIQVPAANGVLANDYFGLPAATITSPPTTTTQGGDLTLNADGSFTYNPPAGFEGTDTFTYTLTNSAGSNTGTVTIAVSGMIWFIDNSLATNGNGRLSAPFNSLASFIAGAADDPGDNIFLYRQTATNYTGVLTLLNNQRLIGQGATASLSSITGITPPAGSLALPTTGGTNPVIAGNVTLGTSNLIRGLNISAASGTALSGTNFSSFTASECNISNSGGRAISLTHSVGTGSLNATFVSVSASGGVNGIFLQNTTGSFTVTGDGVNTTRGGNSSGGTITNATGANSSTNGIGVYLNNAQNITLRRLTINGTNQNFGIYGANVTNFVFEYSTVSGVNGNAAPVREGAVVFDNLFGSANTINESVISGGVEDNLRIENTSSTVLSTCNITNNNIQNNSTVTGNIGVRFAAFNSANMTGVISGNNFNGNRTDTINCDSANSSTVNLTIANNIITRGTAGNNEGNLGINVTAGATGQMTFDVDNNRVGTPDGVTNSSLMNTGINIFAGNNSTMNGRVRNNKIINRGAGFSGNGIDVFQDLLSAINIRVDANTVSNVGLDFGLRVQANGDAANSGGAVQAAVTNNNVSVLPGAIDAIRVRSRRQTTLCARITGNTTSAGGSGFFGLFVAQSDTSTLNLEGGTSNLATNNPGIAPANISTSGTINTVTANFCSGIPAAVVLEAQSGKKLTDAEVLNLTDDELSGVVKAAITRWEATGISYEDVAKLREVTFTVADLPERYLSQGDEKEIRIDQTAAGFGWYVDPSPYDEWEYDLPLSAATFEGSEQSPAYSRMDLLTVVMNALGRVLESYRLNAAKDQQDSQLAEQGNKFHPLDQSRELMQTTLPVGVRRVPNAASLGFIIPELASEEASGSSPVTPLRLEPASVSSAT